MPDGSRDDLLLCVRRELDAVSDAARHVGRAQAERPGRSGPGPHALVWGLADRLDRFIDWHAGRLAPPWTPDDAEDPLPGWFWTAAQSEPAPPPGVLNWYEVQAMFEEARLRFTALLVSLPAETLCVPGAVRWCGGWSLARWADETGPRSCRAMRPGLAVVQPRRDSA